MLPRYLRPLGPLRRFGCAAFALLVIILAGFSAASAHEGHDHGDAKPAVVSSAWPRVAIESELYELVGILKDGHLTIYLDHFATNEPVPDAAIAVTVGEDEPIDAKPSEHGTFVMSSPRFAEGGAIELVFAIRAKGGDDLLLGQLVLRRAGTPVATASGGSGALWPTLTAWVPAFVRNPAALSGVTFVLGILFAVLFRRRRKLPAAATAAAVAGVLALLAGTAFGHEGHQHDNDKPAPAAGAPTSDAPRRLPDGTVFVAKPTQRLLEVRTVTTRPQSVHPTVSLIGRVIADPNRSGLVQSINGGRVIAPEGGLPIIGQAVRKGDVLATIEPTVPQADRTTISDRMGEIEQLIASAEARLKRLRQLAEKNAAPLSQVTDVEIELEGLTRRREVIRQMRVEWETLRAPTDGVIVSAKVVPGQVVQAQDIVFQIVDPQALWIEALVYGEAKPSTLTDATVTVGEETMQLAFRGFNRTLQQQASIVLFAIKDPTADLSIGRSVTVIARVGSPMTGLVLARDAIVRSPNGEAIVWVHIEPERFEARPVRVQPLDGSRLVVAAGIKEGDRIVVRGADLVNQVR